MAATDDGDDELMGTPGLEGGTDDAETIVKTECCVASVVVENDGGRVVFACQECGQRGPDTKPYNVSDLQMMHDR